VWRLLSTAHAEQDHVFPKRLIDLSVVIHGARLRRFLWHLLALRRANNRPSIWHIDQRLVHLSHKAPVRFSDLGVIAATSRLLR
jgi:hypothetical protein